MIIHNADIAAAFSQIADLLEIKGDNPFRIRAYRNAVRMLNALPNSVQEMVKAKQSLRELPGIGVDLEEKIIDIANTGTCVLLEELLRELPPAIDKLLTVPGLGPKRVKTLYQELNIQNLEQLYRAAKKGRISKVPGFGRKVEQRILEALQAQRSKKMRVKLALVEPIVEALLAHLHASKAAKQSRLTVAFAAVKKPWVMSIFWLGE